MLNPWLAIGIAVLCVGWSAIFIRWAAPADPMVISALRLLVAALFWTPLYFRARRKFTGLISAKQQWARILAGLFLGLHFILWISSFSYTTVSSAVFLILTQPILSAIGAHLFLREKLNRWNGVAIVLTVIGSWIICRGDLALGPEFIRGDVLALTGAAASTAYLLLARVTRPARPGQAALPLALYLAPVYWVATISCFAVILIRGVPIGPYSPGIWWSILALGLIPTVIGHSLFNYAMGHLPAFSVNIALVGEPIISSVLAWWLLAEVPGGSLIVGGLVLVSAIYFVLRWPPGDPVTEIVPD